MQIHFRSTENQSRWLWTEGLQTLGQREIAVIISWSEHDLRDRLIAALLRFLEQYLTSQPKRILPDQTFRYGWILLRFVRDEHNLSRVGTDVLLIEEMQHPFSHDDPSYIPGVEHTMALMQVQHEAMQRTNISGDVIYPHGFQHAIICKRVTSGTVHLLRPLKAHRAWQPDIHDSGWFVGCCDPGHDHDNADELASVHLLHLVTRFPGLFPYLAMPVGTMLIFEENQVIIFRPDEQDGQVDPGKILSVLPC